MPSLSGGGAERMLLRLAEEFVERGIDVDLLLTRVKADNDRAVPGSLSPVRLRRCSMPVARYLAMQAAGRQWPHLIGPVLRAFSSSWALRYLPALADYLREHRPDVLLSANSWPNLVAIWARRLAGVQSRIVVSERVQLGERVRHLRRHARWRNLPRLIGEFYPEAVGVIAVSEGVARDLVSSAELPPETVKFLPNPVVSSRLEEMADAPVTHPWLADADIPVILGAGRLHPQKDFPSLLRAFALVREVRPARLIILGEGDQRTTLERLASTLGIEADFALPGHVENPFAYMKRSSVFVLSSRYEGLPGVLIQAMACGCPVVSTDCPSGPREIMKNGKLGALVPVGNFEDLAKAVLDAIDEPVPAELLKARASNYSVQAATDAYLQVLLPEIYPTL
ncbi:MAG TPA: glycosyltransferase [Paracoccaceae bacterium]|nr:glycosyltransferase [Paracoccaceae bacterium]